MVSKHVQDPSLADLIGGTDFTMTSTERGVQRWEQQHLIASLDILNAYQIDRCSRASCGVAGHRPGMKRQFANDPRTRLVELLKRWLRTHAGSSTVNEDEVRGVCGLCREVLNHPELFAARNPRSFLQAIAEVYDHLRWQLREVLERDRTCAELASHVVSLSRNLISDTIAFLLVAPTDLRQTDALASLEVVALWQSLPSEGHPLPGRADPALQRAMRSAWRTRCGSMIAALLSTPWCLHLFDGAGKDSVEALVTNAGALACIKEAEVEFTQQRFKDSGLAGAFRTPSQEVARRRYLEVVEVTSDLMYLLGEVFAHFHRVSDSLGDYGAIAVGQWMHPFLDALVHKVQRLSSNLEGLNKAIDDSYVIARARGTAVEKPGPSSRMSARAHAAIERAVIGRGAHVPSLLKAIDDLKSRSSPERLPHVMGGLGDACQSLRIALSSPDFRACVGGAFPDVSLLGQPAATPVLAQSDRSHMKALPDQPSCPTLMNKASADHDSIRKVEAPCTPERLPCGELRADVRRMVPSGCGSGLWKRDERSLVLADGCLQIFDPVSNDSVKMAVNVQRDLDEFKLLPGGLLAISVVKVPETAAAEEGGVREFKAYVFAFSEPTLAKAFCRQLRELSDLDGSTHGFS